MPTRWVGTGDVASSSAGRERMESAGRRQGERAGNAESTWSAGHAAGGAGKRRSGPTSQVQRHLMLVWMDGC